MNRDEFANTPRGRGARIGCSLYRADVAPDHNRDITRANVLLAGEYRRWRP